MTTDDVRKVLREELAPLVEEIERHSNTLYADNGEKGLVIRTLRLEDAVRAGTESAKRAVGLRDKLIFALIGAVLTFSANTAASWMRDPGKVAPVAVQQP